MPPRCKRATGAEVHASAPLELGGARKGSGPEWRPAVGPGLLTGSGGQDVDADVALLTLHRRVLVSIVGGARDEAGWKQPWRMGGPSRPSST
ncbi:hypothetical protein B296_00057901 [Ensete ventricosum]|uniref:Uncharacterized protein n=1 Tax=Ensete ventricosum TaxID=4639 RepID=A0A426X2I7_ENSVE|nr:hypothetical protein B296_00057901 [Ensete ventricosum]